MPLLEGPIILQIGGAAKPPLKFTLYLPLLVGAYFGRIFCHKKTSKNQKSEIAPGLSPTLDNIYLYIYIYIYIYDYIFAGPLAQGMVRSQ